MSKTLIYFIATPRSDGTAPSLSKALQDRFFLTYEEAYLMCFKHNFNGDFGYEVFHAFVEIPAVGAVTKEIAGSYNG